MIRLTKAVFLYVASIALAMQMYPECAYSQLTPVRWKGKEEVFEVDLPNGLTATTYRRTVRARKGNGQFRASYQVAVPGFPSYLLQFDGHTRGLASDVSFMPKVLTEENWLAGRELFGSRALFDTLEGLHDDFDYFEIVDPKTETFTIARGIERAKSPTSATIVKVRDDYDTRTSYILDRNGRLFSEYESRRGKLSYRQWDSELGSFARVPDEIGTIKKKFRTVSHSAVPGPDITDLLAEVFIAQMSTAPDSPMVHTIEFGSEMFDTYVYRRIYGAPNSETRKLHERRLRKKKASAIFPDYDYLRREKAKRVAASSKNSKKESPKFSRDERGFWDTPIPEQIGKAVYRFSPTLGDRLYSW